MKIFALTGNEFTKIFSKKSTYVIIIIALASCFLLPFMNYKSANISHDSYYTQNLNSEIEWTQNTLNVYSDINTRLDNIMDYCYQTASLQILNLKLNAGITSYDDWRETESYNLINKYIESYYISYIINDNKEYIEALEKSGSLSEYVNQEALSEYLSDGSLTKLRQRYDALQSEITAISNAILNNDPAYFNQYYLTQMNNDIAQINNSIAETNKLMAQTSNEEEKQIYSENITELNSQLQLLNELLVWKQYRADNNISRDAYDWRNICVNSIESAINFQYQLPYTKEQFDEYSQYDYALKDMTYEDYLIYFDNQKAEQRDIITLYTYHLDNNIPPAQYASSTRMQLQSIYYVITLTALVGIIIAAPIVSSEYNKGTIRLLLIRPVKRYKILLSKILAVLILLIILFALFTVIYILSNIALFGYEDYSYPMLSISEGNIVSKSILETILPVLLKSAISVFFIASMVIMFSTVTKSTVLAVAMPFMFLAFSGLMGSILIYLQYYTIAEYTIFAYMNLYDIINQTGTIGNMILNDPSLNLNVNIGFALHLGYGLLMLILSFIVFSKRDIKN